MSSRAESKPSRVSPSRVRACVRVWCVGKCPAVRWNTCPGVRAHACGRDRASWRRSATDYCAMVCRSARVKLRVVQTAPAATEAHTPPADGWSQWRYCPSLPATRAGAALLCAVSLRRYRRPHGHRAPVAARRLPGAASSASPFSLSAFKS